MKIKAVVFDYGGVICFPPSVDTETELQRLTGLPAESLSELNRKYRDGWDRGTYNGIEYYRHILSSSGIFLDDDSLAGIALIDMDGWKRINTGTVQLMYDVKAAGLTLGIFSNMPLDFFPWVKDNLRIFNEAQAVVISSCYNLVKPETAFFKVLQEKTACEYGEIIFFDDISDNVKAARDLGIAAHLWEGADAARKTVTEQIGKNL